MAKKLPFIISALTILAGFGLQPPTVNALPFEEEEETKWSVIELLNHGSSVYKRILNDCRGATDVDSCISDDVNTIIANEDNQDSAFLHLRNLRFVVSSIDYAKGSIKFIFFNNDVVKKLQGITSPNVINNAYIGWLASPRANYYYTDFNYLYEGRMDNSQYIVASLNGSNSLFAIPNQIIEVKDPSYETNNIFDTIAYSIEGNNDFKVHRQFYFGGCTGGDYEEGMECRAMINGKGDLVYRRFTGTEAIPAPLNEDFSLYNDGYAAGTAAGYSNGYTAGLDEGYDDGYDNGYNDGYAAGHSVGKIDGENSGYVTGHNEGYNEGYDEGYHNGNNDGLAEGYEAGLANGYESGRESGLAEGYQAGYENGLEEGYNQGFASGQAEGTEEGYRIGFDDGYAKAREEAVTTEDNNAIQSNPDGGTSDPAVQNINESKLTLRLKDTDTVLTTQSTVHRPDTGAATNEEAHSSEFPWWLGVIFMTGLATTLWLFWPNRKKSQKK